MATVNGLSKERMLEIEAASVVDGDVVGDDLMLTRHDGTTFYAGNVRGPKGDNAMAGRIWAPGTSYVVGDTAGYSGRLYTCIQANSNKCPPFNNNYWSPVIGGDFETWPLNDSYFMAEDLDAHNTFWRSGSVTTTLTKVAGEFETGYQAMKVALGANSSLRIFEEAEVLVRGGETITVTVRAKLMATVAVLPTVIVELWQAPPDGIPEVFGPHASPVAATPVSSQLSAAWVSYTFTMQAVAGKPRGRINVILAQPTGASSTIVLDRIEVSRIATVTNLKADKTYVDAQIASTSSSLTASRNVLVRKNFQMNRAQHILNGGGIRYVSSTGAYWRQRFMVMGLGRNSTSTPTGWWDIAAPPAGTVITKYGIPGGGTSTVTVTATEVPMDFWDALYYELPYGSANASVPGNFRIVTYQSDFEIPEHWVLICLRNSDTESMPYAWGDGQQMDYWRNLTLANGWVPYGQNWLPPQYRRISPVQASLRGLMKSGTVGPTTTAFTVPAHLVPDGEMPTSGQAFLCLAASGQARVDIHNDGNGRVVQLLGGATNAYVSLDNITWDLGFAG